MQKIIENVYTFTGLLVGRVYCITDADGLTIIDAGLALAVPRILAQLREAGFAPGDVKRILITHAHPDHIGGLPALQAATGAEVICSAVERPFTEGTQKLVPPAREDLPPLARMMLPRESQALPGTPVTRTLEPDEVLPEVLGGLQAVATPGHSPGHTSFWQPALRLLFSGDVVLRVPGLRLPFAAFTSDMAQSKRSLQKVASLEPSLVLFGHGVPMHNAAPVLKAFAQRVMVG
jgi:glyoxylase-like metal-dependent hydrolase (beta-lactamase superfamily II)